MINETIGRQLKKYRESKNFSLDDVVTLTGDSKPSLSNIERAATSPSINILWKISKGLGLPIAYFFEEKEAVYELVNIDNLNRIDTGNNLIKAFSAFTWNPSNNFEIFYVELIPGAERLSDAHVDGSVEIIIPLKGELLFQVNDEEIKIAPQKLFKFNSDIDHKYMNQGAETCELIIVMMYPFKE
ncbi:helix-turn-helix domain-containing protein [Lactococcus lactis]|uniref:helix-turn-helix domain-containing protein n=1 Tax=Lactococcus lactis TaxID=1358 RepID=UPI002891ADF5|nr:helix-turn-helix domain-containing protein [Lactococcus lactis]MDT2885571.1 helix-turn-helix domain-containing protein [Lactococcus lactis]MDT2904799.1 helix-turn-helix domain-containing protein [Lactococcus lactis]MDT2910574.1 helix-turn-helix domain-containing protein [Lactococcus lactis]MDT2929333.1 helix-turn-helix domain-containing protein [Lactococcus lactis]MDT2931681.1 helix-turn-helix domain-containing protein [Lactococcus lactis]